jgi:signal transduction histidine kinase
MAYALPISQSFRRLADRLPRLVDSGASLVVVLVVPFGGELVAYAIGRHRPGRQAWPAAATVQVVVAANLLFSGLPTVNGIGSLVLADVLMALLFLLGRKRAARKAHLVGLEERAERLEQEREQQLQLAAASERARIAREMHDIVAHNLAVMVALADGAAMTAPTAPEQATGVMHQVSATGREALTEMRKVLGLLRHDPQVGEPDLRPQPGFADLDTLVDQVRQAGIEVTLAQQGAPAAWGPSAGLAVYRILQEALTNTMKHAGSGASVQIRLHYTSGGVTIEMTDDGGTLSPVPRAAPPLGGANQSVDGYGLVGLAERAAAFGGQLRAGPTVGGGWQVRTSLRFSGDLAR